jgi:hypothetical protein
MDCGSPEDGEGDHQPGCRQPEPGRSFVTKGTGFVRIALVTEPEVLAEAAGRIRRDPRKVGLRQRFPPEGQALAKDAAIFSRMRE